MKRSRDYIDGFIHGIYWTHTFQYAQDKANLIEFEKAIDEAVKRLRNGK